MRLARFREIAGRVLIAAEWLTVGMIVAFTIWIAGLFFGWWG